MLFSRVNIGCSYHFVYFVPRRANKSTHATFGLIRFSTNRVFYNKSPGIHRIFKLLASITPQFQQWLAYFGILYSVGTVDIPRETGTPRATTRLMVGQVRTRTRIICLLSFPGDQSIFNVNFPATGAGTVHPMGRTYNFVVLPTLAVAVLPLSVLIPSFSVTIGELIHLGLFEEL